MASSYSKLLDSAYARKPLEEVLKASPAALRGLSAADAQKLAEAINVRTVAELAQCKYHLAARTILAATGRPSFDPGPPDAWLDIFAQAPLQHYVDHPSERFRIHFGPVYYRGRLDGTARVLVLGQDPSTNEILAQRAFVGASGQRVQKLLGKIGITRSYVIFNTFLFSVFGQFDTELRAVSLEREILDYRNQCLDRTRAENPLQAVIAFGAAPRHAFENWAGGQGLPVFFLTHPAADDGVVLANWNSQLGAMAAAITPDLDGAANTAPYGTAFTVADIAPIPAFDLPFGIPDWHGRGGGHSGRDGNDKIIWTSPLS
jgi:hypothetical protein